MPSFQLMKQTQREIARNPSPKRERAALTQRVLASRKYLE
jgi:hypothetical protein